MYIHRKRHYITMRKGKDVEKEAEAILFIYTYVCMNNLTLGGPGGLIKGI